MTDDGSSDPQPSDPSDPMGAEMISEADLDDVLSQASSLAADLSQEIGQDPGPAPAGAASIDAGDEQVTAEVGLDELERLVAATREEVDGAEEESVAPDPPSKEPVDLAVPDFMSEFTEPAPPPPDNAGGGDASPEPPAALDASLPQTATASDAKVVSDPSMGIVATGTIKKEAPPEPLGVVGTPSPEVADDAASPSADDTPSPAADDAAAEASSEPSVKRPAAIVRGLVAKASPMLFMACDHGVSLLEKIDRPLQRIGPSPRRFLGWLAIATLGTSLVVFIVSVF